ncbi:DUF4352 domain-containing protein [Nocardia sp. NPDC057455]|uniref:DUF4352 domain-containing protein n=1 Tax=Nocardia sp. NPDC057455 TaxID=3346138 RepID=UPI00366C3FDF
MILLCGGCFGIAGIAANDSTTAGADKTSTTRPAAPEPPAAAPPAPAGEPQPPKPADPPKSDIAPAGSPVRDGKFEFVVTRVDPPVKTVGDNQFLSETAQGQYILVHVNVSNIGDAPRGYFGSNQTLYDDQGRKFTNDSMAEINVNDHMSVDINPGNKVSVTLVFDVPPGAVPATLELHDSMFSRGAKVALR